MGEKVHQEDKEHEKISDYSSLHIENMEYVKTYRSLLWQQNKNEKTYKSFHLEYEKTYQSLSAIGG